MTAAEVALEQLGAACHERLGAAHATVGEIAGTIQQPIYRRERKPFLGFRVPKLRINGYALRCRLGTVLVDVTSLVVEPGPGVPIAEDR